MNKITHYIEWRQILHSKNLSDDVILNGSNFRQVGQIGSIKVIKDSLIKCR